MTLWDAPNQQVVRDDHSPPWEEGTGGAPEVPGGAADLEAMTKDQLLARAVELGVSPANAGMSKAELLAAVAAAGG